MLFVAARAAARAGPLRDWLKVAGLLGKGGRRRSAESLALGTAVEIAVVRALDLALAGLAVAGRGNTTLVSRRGRSGSSWRWRC